jgi:hypothetical protein
MRLFEALISTKKNVQPPPLRTHPAPPPGHGPEAERRPPAPAARAAEERRGRPNVSALLTARSTATHIKHGIDAQALKSYYQPPKKTSPAAASQAVSVPPPRGPSSYKPGGSGFGAGCFPGARALHTTAKFLPCPISRPPPVRSRIIRHPPCPHLGSCTGPRP